MAFDENADALEPGPEPSTVDSRLMPSMMAYFLHDVEYSERELSLRTRHRPQFEKLELRTMASCLIGVEMCHCDAKFFKRFLDKFEEASERRVRVEVASRYYADLKRVCVAFENKPLLDRFEREFAVRYEPSEATTLVELPHSELTPEEKHAQEKNDAVTRAFGEIYENYKKKAFEILDRGRIEEPWEAMRDLLGEFYREVEVYGEAHEHAVSVTPESKRELRSFLHRLFPRFKDFCLWRCAVQQCDEAMEERGGHISIVFQMHRIFFSSAYLTVDETAEQFGLNLLDIQRCVEFRIKVNHQLRLMSQESDSLEVYASNESTTSGD